MSESNRRAADLLDRLVTWSKTNCPASLKVEPGLGRDEMEPLGVFPHRLPESYRAWLRVCGGLDTAALDPWILCDAQIAASVWLSQRDSLRGQAPIRETRDTDAARPDAWNESWWPIALDGGGNFLFLDYAPGPAGRTGQLCVFDHEGARSLLARSLPAWLGERLKHLESGRLIWNAEMSQLQEVGHAASKGAGLASIAKTVVAALTSNQEIDVPGLGGFYISRRRGYSTTDPRSGAERPAPERRLPTFRSSDFLRALVNDETPPSPPAQNESIVRDLAAKLLTKRSVTVRGLGQFAVSRRREFNCTDPETGEQTVVPAVAIVVFRASDALRTAMQPTQ